MLLLTPAACNHISSKPTSTAITIASWNIAWLGDGINDEILQGNQYGGKHLRSEADFARLRAIIARLNAEILVLQEVENEAAVRRILPGNNWKIFISQRRTDPAWAQRVAVAVDISLPARRLPDVTSLALDGKLRHGLDLEITQGKKRFRLLGIHLKSGCFTRHLLANKDCERLRQQLPKLKAWIKERVAESIPFIIVGDWNREIGRAHDSFFAALNDGSLKTLALIRLGDKITRRCWDKKRQAVDHIVLGDHVAAPTWENSLPFSEHTYRYKASLRPLLSDHCPITAELGLATP